MGNCTAVASDVPPWLMSHMAVCWLSPLWGLCTPAAADRARGADRLSTGPSTGLSTGLSSRLTSGSGQGSGQGVVLAKGGSGCTSPWTLLPALVLHWEPVIHQLPPYSPSLTPYMEMSQGNEWGKKKEVSLKFSVSLKGDM